jgi:hypothetical protein
LYYAVTSFGFFAASLKVPLKLCAEMCGDFLNLVVVKTAHIGVIIYPDKLAFQIFAKK